MVSGKPAGLRVLLSEHREQIERWLYVERRSLREVERLCRERGWPIGRRSLAAYMRALEKSGAAPLVVADTAERNLRRLQRLASVAGEKLEQALADDKLTTRDLLEMLKLELALYGPRNAAAFSESVRRWETAFRVLIGAITTYCDTATQAQIHDACLANPDFAAVYHQAIVEQQEEAMAPADEEVAP